MILVGVGCMFFFLSLSWAAIVANSPLRFVLGVFGVFLVITLASLVVTDFFESRCKKTTKIIDDKVTDERKDAAEQVMKKSQWTPHWKDRRIVNTLAYKRRKH